MDLTFLTFLIFMRKKKNRFIKHKTNSNQNMCFQNVEGKHKEKATCVSDVNVGSIYMICYLIFHVPLFTYFWLYNKSPSSLVQLLQSIEASRGLFNRLWLSGLIEIALDIILNTKFHERFTSKLNAINYWLIQMNQLFQWIV